MQFVGPTLQEKLAQFRPKGPLTATAQMRVMKLQTAFETMVSEIHDLVPCCPDQTVALRRLLEVKWICTQAVTHSKEFSNDPPQRPQTQAQPEPPTEAPKAPEAPVKGDVEIEAEKFQKQAEEKAKFKGKT